MSIILSKNLKQKQSVKLTPSLKKSIDLLQLSRFELIKKIDKEIIENPFLEKNDVSNDYEDFNHSDFSFDIESKVKHQHPIQLKHFQQLLVVYQSIQS